MTTPHPTTLGTLHAADQPLEPFFLGPTLPIVLPFDPHDRPVGDEAMFLRVAARDAGLGRRVLLAAETDSTFRHQGAEADGLPVVATAIRIPPQRHGLVHHLPRTLGELRALLAPAGIEILEVLRARLRTPRPWHQRQVLKAHLLLVVLLPKTREPGGAIEDTEAWLIYREESLLRIGAALGAWRTVRHRPEPLDRPCAPDRGGDLRIHVLNPMAPFTRERAAEYNGLAPQGAPAIVAVGAGALGSQVVLNLVRAGWGGWTLVDEDYLLPHNLARHALFGFAVGRPKTTGLAVLADDLIDGPPMVEPIVADVLQPGPAATALQAAWERATVLLDMSASITVARHLARGGVAPRARRLSLFLNPAGTDLVLLAEDAGRAIPLDALEFQYYRLVAGAPELADHLRPPPDRIRYARSCREVSAALPQELVALHAAIGSGAIRAALARDAATIVVWRADPAALTVTSGAGFSASRVTVRAAGWRVYTDRSLLSKVARARAAKLPNETGGVLLGAFDLQHKSI